MAAMNDKTAVDVWPALPYDEWKDTYDTLHMWTQIAGKVRLELSPMVNHWWQVALHVTPRGLTTTPIPYGGRTFEIQFDLIDHNLAILTSDGAARYMSLYPRTVADFYRELMSILKALGLEVRLFTKPQEVPDPILFEEDTAHASYDEEYANRLLRILVETDSVFKEFRGRFTGKASPVLFYWGSFDLSMARYSGRRAPERPGADLIQREAGSHEYYAAGFWPGSGSVLAPAYYAYIAPEPVGLRDVPVRPEGAHFDTEMGCLVNETQVKTVSGHVDDAVAKGATLVAGGKARPDLGPLFYEPTVLTDVPEDAECYRDETFGPVVSVYPVDNVDEAIRRAFLYAEAGADLVHIEIDGSGEDIQRIARARLPVPLKASMDEGKRIAAIEPTEEIDLSTVLPPSPPRRPAPALRGSASTGVLALRPGGWLTERLAGDRRSVAVDQANSADVDLGLQVHGGLDGGADDGRPQARLLRELALGDPDQAPERRLLDPDKRVRDVLDAPQDDGVIERVKGTRASCTATSSRRCPSRKLVNAR